MGVGLVRSLQPPDILWIHWRVYNFIANTNKRVLFLPPSDAYVRSFPYLLYTLIKLYYTKALSDQASSLAPDWILLLWGPRIPASWFNNNLSSWGLVRDPSGQGKDAWSSSSLFLSKHVFCCALLTLQCARVNEWHALCEASDEPCSAVPQWSHMADGRNLSGVYTGLPMPRGTQCLLWEPTRNGQSVWTELSFLGQTFRSLWPFHNSLGIRTTNLLYQIIDFQGTCDLYCYCVLWLRSKTWIGSQEAPSLAGNQKFGS